jgi:hypothetical protein
MVSTAPAITRVNRATGDDTRGRAHEAAGMHSAESPGMRYCIVVKGRLSERCDDMFGRLAREPLRGYTALRGPVVDQAELYGVLNRLRDLGIELVSVNADE